MKKLLLGTGLLAALGLSLFNHWEPGGETWGYWFFARIFSETGRFIIFDRSPLYVLYLLPFRLLGYPEGVTVEYFATTLITCLALIVLFKRYLGPAVAVVGSILWIPFLQTMDPPVQKLALACCCLAVAVRQAKPTPVRWSVSYALFLAAWMFRSIYLVFPILFLSWDLFTLIRARRVPMAVRELRAWTAWPLLVVVALLVWFARAPSPHPWNNSGITTDRWFPSNGGTLRDAGFIQNYNWTYIEQRYGTYRNHDFYFTNNELFGGARTMGGAIRANPGYVAAQLARNTAWCLHLVANMTTVLPRSFAWVFKNRMTVPTVRYVQYAYDAVLLAAIGYGLLGFVKLHRRRDADIVLLILGDLGILAVTIVGMPKARYMFPMVPILLCCTAYLATRLSSLLRGRFTRLAAITALLIVMSDGVADWARLTVNLAADVLHHRTNVLVGPAPSFKASFQTREALIAGCRGILSIEHTFVGAFMHVPLTRVFDIWEVPPFGELDASAYHGLQPERVDCVLLNSELTKGEGAATSIQLRYEHYIEPYVETLRRMGARTVSVEGYGDVVMLGSR